MTELIYIAVKSTTGLYSGAGESYSLVKARKDRDELEQELEEEYGEARVLLGQKEWRRNNGTTIETVTIKEMICK